MGDIPAIFGRTTAMTADAPLINRTREIWKIAEQHFLSEICPLKIFAMASTALVTDMIIDVVCKFTPYSFDSEGVMVMNML